MSQPSFPQPDEPTRSDELIEAAKEAGRKAGKFSLGGMLLMLGAASCALAGMRWMGVFTFWKSWLGFFLAMAYLFGPLLFWVLSTFVWRKQQGHLGVAVGASAVLAGVLVVILATSYEASSSELAKFLLGGAIFWTAEIVTIFFVRWSLFRRRPTRRVLPDQLPR